MKTKAIAAGLAGLLALGSAATIATPIASAHADDAGEHAQARAERRADRLEDLVAEGVITQEQADEITARFEERAAEKAAAREERAAMLAELLGIGVDELQAALESGQSLAELAVANGVSVDSLINDLVIEASARLDERVAEGSIDAARADEIRAGLVDRITARVNGERPERGGHHGRFGGGPFGGPGTESAPAGFGPAFAGVGEA